MPGGFLHLRVTMRSCVAVASPRKSYVFRFVSKFDRSKDKPFPEGGGRPQEFQNLAADVFQGANSVP